VERKLAAILVADMVAYSRLMEADEEGTISRQSTHRSELIDPEIDAYGGRIFKTTGDGLLVEFPSVVDAVRCATNVQRVMAEREAGVPEDLRIRYRIGVNLGDIVIVGDDILGDGVNIAARLEQLAEPGGVCISGNAYDQLKAKVDVGYADLGEQRVKNIEIPVRAYRVLLDADAAGTVISETRPHFRRWQLGAIAALVLAVITVGGLAWWQPWLNPLPDKPSIAVLPFNNMSGDPRQEYFADGVTEDVITGLSKFGLFFVVSRNSTFAYKGTSVNVKQVSRDLGVRYVLEGSIRKSGERVRISVQLIDAKADKHIWAETYDRKLTDVFKVQDDITEKIIASVAPKYLSAEIRRAQRVPARNLDAWDAFIRGYWHFLRFTKSDHIEAQRMFNKSITLDSGHAKAMSMLAMTNLIGGLYGWIEPRSSAMEAARQNAEMAISIDPEDPMVVRARGIVNLWSKNQQNALRDFKQAVALNPNEAESHALLGAAHGALGDYDKARSSFDIAMRLSPRDQHVATWYNYLSMAAVTAAKYEEAADWAKKAVQSNPKFPAGYRSLAASLGNTESLSEAKEAVVQLRQLLPNVSINQLRSNFLFFNDPLDLERYLNGLRRAGLPEN
jgi:adenylate cyclase